VSRRLAAALLLAMLAACSRQAARNEATPAPTPTAPATPAITSATGSAALPTPELDGVATAQGKWTFQISDNSAQAAFGIPGRRSLFALHCDVEGRRIVFTRAASGSAKSMQIVASNGAATFPAGTDGHGRITASDFVTDTFLTQVLATATGRIGVKLNAEPTLAMPVDPVIGQIIERCAAPRE